MEEAAYTTLEHERTGTHRERDWLQRGGWPGSARFPKPSCVMPSSQTAHIPQAQELTAQSQDPPPAVGRGAMLEPREMAGRRSTRKAPPTPHPHRTQGLVRLAKSGLKFRAD